MTSVLKKARNMDIAFTVMVKVAAWGENHRYSDALDNDDSGSIESVPEVKFRVDGVRVSPEGPSKMVDVDGSVILVFSIMKCQTIELFSRYVGCKLVTPQRSGVLN
jgi:hypothetical protein